MSKKENNLERIIEFAQSIQNDCQRIVLDASNAKKSTDCMDLMTIETAFKRISGTADSAYQLTIDTYDEYTEE